MAKYLGKEADVYIKERDGFLRDLQHFHDTKNTPFRRIPNLNGTEIDLYLLYSLVTQEGGWIKVNSRNSWSDFFKALNIPENCVNGSIALKQIYLRYLERWEKVHYLGEEGDRGSDDDEESRHKRWSARALHSVPHIYNYHQHNIADSVREFNHLSTELYKPSDYDRLALSLLSPLPNEQDFAINVCTLLSNDGKHTLKLEKHPRLVDYLLGHAGVFNHGSLRNLMGDSYGTIRKQNIGAFWKETLPTSEFLDLTDENLYLDPNESLKPLLFAPNASTTPATSSSSTQNANDRDTSSIELSDTESDLELFASDNCVINNIQKGRGFKLKLKTNQDDRELFNLGRNVGTRDYMGQRVLQIATILRNLSFFDENLPLLVKNTTFVRFSMLCACSHWNQLMNLGMEMLGNLASEFLLINDKLSTNLLKIVTRGLHTEDRNWCITSLEVLNKLSQTEANEETLLKILEADVYKRVCSFLTIHDVMLLIYTLECLYALSSLGERACNYIVDIYGVIDTLVSLVTVEGKSYGPKACIGMKLVETVTGNIAQTQQVSTVTTTTNVASNVSAVTTPTATATTVKIANASTPQRHVQIAPQRLLATTNTPNVTKVTTATVTTQQQQLQQKHAHQQTIQENEQFALTWLRATYELCPNSKVDHQELYKHYINSCAKIGRRGVIAPLHFPRCVRSVFGGTVGPNPEKPANANDPQYYDGIKVRAQPLVINVQSATIPSSSIISPASPTPIKGARRKIQTTNNPNLSVVADSNLAATPTSLETQTTSSPSPASPILKAQLSAPPKQPRDQNNVNKADVMKSQVMAHPHLSQALLGSGCANSITPTSAATSGNQKEQGQSNTSLIKSLLATKVNECMSPVSMRTDVAQVAARQQQQRLLAQQNQSSDTKTAPKVDTTPKNNRLNGARQLFSSSNDNDDGVSSTTQGLNTCKSRREPPQPPPPLAPLSNTNNKSKSLRIDNEDSDSLTSSTGLGNLGVGCVSSTEDGDNSLTSFEGLLNGIPSVENNDDNNSKDSIINKPTTNKKPLMLADLLEKKVVDKDPPILNGAKELRIGEKGLELVENHIDKVLNKENEQENGVKRSATDDIVESEPKKPHLISNNVNGNVDSPAPDSSSSNSDETQQTASTAAAKLFADLAADILEDEENETMQEQPEITSPAPVPQPVVQTPVQQVFVDNNQQVLVTQPRQIIVSQTGTNQVVIPAGALKGQPNTVIVQNAQPRANVGQILLSHQLVPSGQPGQYVIQTGGAQGYVVAQPQTAVVHGQPQTVLVAQTTQQQGAGTKTIIILQQNAGAGNQPKVVVTPQGQQMVVTQVQRPIIQQTSPAASVIKTSTANVITTTHANIISTANGITATTDKKLVEEVKPVIVKPKPKIIRDLTTPFVCEWGDCQIETKFKSANQVFMHVCATHIPEANEEMLCLWDRCDSMKRKRFSLMTHINDKHCNTEAMKASLIKRKQIQHTGKQDPPAPPPPTQHPGYAPDAALHAIKRHALEFVNPKELQRTTVVANKQGTTVVPATVPRPGPTNVEQDDNEGPVTKSIRLTASLILRNLVIYSSTCRRYLKHYEPHLANVALSNVESSRTIAQVLYDMNDCTSHR